MNKWYIPHKIQIHDSNFESCRRQTYLGELNFAWEIFDIRIRSRDKLGKRKNDGGAFILRSDKSRYKTLLDGLKRSTNLGKDEYPTTLTEAFNLLVRESGEYDSVHPRNNRYHARGGRGGKGCQSYLFAQQGHGDWGGRGMPGDECNYSRTNDGKSDEVVAGRDGEIFPNVTCFGCNFHGHYRNMCPYTTSTGVISIHVGYMLTQGRLFDIPKSWLLLDTCSTCDVSNTPTLVTNAHACMPEEMLTAYTNGGAQRYEKIADLSILALTVHF